MNSEIFWELIDQSRKDADGDLDTQHEIIVSKLSQYTVEEIFEFDRIFNKYYVDSYASDLWAAAYIINDGCSDDGFDYFRAWLISKGKKVYEDALKNPDSLADRISDEEYGEFEEFLSIANDAYSVLTGRDDFYDRPELVTYPYPEIELTWHEDSEELREMFPKLAEKFW